MFDVYRCSVAKPTQGLRPFVQVVIFWKNAWHPRVNLRLQRSMLTDSSGFVPAQHVLQHRDSPNDEANANHHLE